MWYHPGGIANILSLSRVKDKFWVTYDSSTDNVFKVHLNNGQVRIFSQSKQGLYYSDIRNTLSATVLVNTVAYNKSKYSNRDYLRAIDARKLQNIIGGPSYVRFKQICKNN